MKKSILSMLVVSTLIFTSCSKDDDSGIQKETKETKEVKGTDTEVIPPSSYTFKDADGNSVDFSHQSNILSMISEVIGLTIFKGGPNFPELPQEKMTGMFKDGKGFEGEGLNASGIKIRELIASAPNSTLTASERENIKTKMDGWFKTLVDSRSKYDSGKGEGAIGVPGNVSVNYRRLYYTTKNGTSITNAAKTTMLGAIALDQILNNYIFKDNLDKNKADHEAGKKHKGSNFTTLEHNWDQAYGLAFGWVDSNRGVLGEYLYFDDTFRSPFRDYKDKIQTAFIKGRAAIVVKNYKVMHEQAELIRIELSKAIAMHTLRLLRSKRGHRYQFSYGYFSQGYGFLHTLMFAHTKDGQIGYKGIVEEAITLMESVDLRETSEDSFEGVAKKIADKFEVEFSDALVKEYEFD